MSTIQDTTEYRSTAQTTEYPWSETEFPFRALTTTEYPTTATTAATTQYPPATLEATQHSSTVSTIIKYMLTKREKLAFLTPANRCMSAMFGVLSSARSEVENTTKVVFLKANYNVGVEVLSG